MPDVLIGLSQERPNPTESFLRWWQIPISVPTKRRWGWNTIEHCRLLLQIDGPDMSTQPCKLLWPTLEGPKEEITLHVGEDVYMVPVVLRSEIECQVSGDPVRLPPFHVPERVARISDANAIIHRTVFTDLSPSVWHVLTLRVVSGAAPVAYKKYGLRVPDAQADNAQFTMQARES